MRKDIEIHINTGDIVLSAKNEPVLRTFQWVDVPYGLEDSYLYGEITIPAHNTEDSIIKSGIYIVIPYTPIYKEMKIRIKREYNSTNYSYIRNPKDGSDWFFVRSNLYNQKSMDIHASELIVISESGFYLQFNDGELLIFSGNETDLNITNANWQNRNLLMKCVPGNNFRYPLLGVGLVRWINSNLNLSQLAQALKEQFAEDGTPVKSAKYDFGNKQLYIDIDTSNVD